MLDCFHTSGKVLLISGKRDHLLQRSLLDLLTVQRRHKLLLTEGLRVEGGGFEHFYICAWIFWKQDGNENGEEPLMSRRENSIKALNSRTFSSSSSWRWWRRWRRWGFFIVLFKANLGEIKCYCRRRCHHLLSLHPPHRIIVFYRLQKIAPSSIKP